MHIFIPSVFLVLGTCFLPELRIMMSKTLVLWASWWNCVLYLINDEWRAERQCKWEEVPKISDLERREGREGREGSKSDTSTQLTIYQCSDSHPKNPGINSIRVNHGALCLFTLSLKGLKRRTFCQIYSESFL